MEEMRQANHFVYGRAFTLLALMTIAGLGCVSPEKRGSQALAPVTLYPPANALLDGA